MSLAQEILDYLTRNPQANDTLEGIAGWWLREQKIRHTVADAKAALAELVRRKLVLAHEAADGKTHYRMNPETQLGNKRRANPKAAAPTETRLRVRNRRSKH